MLTAGMAYGYGIQNPNTLPGTLNGTTRWRQLPFSDTNDTLSWLRFDDIAGQTIAVPDGVAVLEMRPGLEPVPAARFGQQFLIEWAKTYQIRQGQARVFINNQRQQSVRASGGARVLRPEPLPAPAPAPRGQPEFGIRLRSHLRSGRP